MNKLFIVIGMIISLTAYAKENIYCPKTIECFTQMGCEIIEGKNTNFWKGSENLVDSGGWPAPTGLYKFYSVWEEWGGLSCNYTNESGLYARTGATRIAPDAPGKKWRKAASWSCDSNDPIDCPITKRII